MSGRRGPNLLMSVFISDVVTIDTEIDVAGDVIKPHCFAGVQFFEDIAGTIPATPSSGTVTITIQTVNTTPVYEAAPANIIDATAPTTVSWASNTQRVKASPAGIVGANNYRLVITCNES